MPAGIYKRKSLYDRFWDKVVKTVSCWLWLGSTKNGGYGQIAYKGKKLYPHRYSFTIHKHKIPDGMQICHSCDNRICVNPDHMFLGTQADNMADMNAKNRHARGRATNVTKLTDENIKEIRAKYASGVTNADLCREYGVSHSTIHRIVFKKLWTHIT